MSSCDTLDGYSIQLQLYYKRSEPRIGWLKGNQLVSLRDDNLQRPVKMEISIDDRQYIDDHLLAVLERSLHADYDYTDKEKVVFV